MNWLLGILHLGPRLGSRPDHRWSERCQYAEQWYDAVTAYNRQVNLSYGVPPDTYQMDRARTRGHAYVFREWQRRRMTIVALLSLHRHRRGSAVSKYASRDILRFICQLVLDIQVPVPCGVDWHDPYNVRISGSRIVPPK